MHMVRPAIRMGPPTDRLLSAGRDYRCGAPTRGDGRRVLELAAEGVADRLGLTLGNEASIAGNPARRRTARGCRVGPPSSVCGLFARRATANRRFSDCPAHAKGA